MNIKVVLALIVLSIVGMVIWPPSPFFVAGILVMMYANHRADEIREAAINGRIDREIERRPEGE